MPSQADNAANDAERLAEIAKLLTPATMNGWPMWGSLTYSRIAEALRLATKEADPDA